MSSFTVPMVIYISGPHPATSQPCLYNYTIGNGSLPVIVTQSAPVCLICSDTTSTMWDISGGAPAGIPGALYILNATTPTSTFTSGPTVSCYAPPGTNLVSSTGEWIICVFLHAINVTMSSSHSVCSISSCPSIGDLCQ